MGYDDTPTKGTIMTLAIILASLVGLAALGPIGAVICGVIVWLVMKEKKK